MSGIAAIVHLDNNRVDEQVLVAAAAAMARRGPDAQQTCTIGLVGLVHSLGVVELTIALHYVFDTPKDKIVWDVGHQPYTHKLLTGRQDRFHTLRQYGGISGFPKRSESVYDAFDTGHSSTSISAALGIASARCLKRERGRVIAVIGDGALTAGLAFEGLNNTGDLQKDLIVVLNDNGMSIAPNVGAMASFFSRKLTKRTLVFLKKQVGDMLRSFPGIGDTDNGTTGEQSRTPA